MKNAYPKIIANFDQAHYTEAVERVFEQTLPPHFFLEKDLPERFLAQLPIISWTPIEQAPCDLSFYLIALYRPNAFRFFYTMVNRWLVPGKEMNAPLQFAIDFSSPDLGAEKYSCGEVMLHIESQRDLDLLATHLPILESELRLGLESRYQEKRILEIKGFSTDEKTALMQEDIVALVKHRPQHFDFDILQEMQHFLVTAREEFKEARTYRHMSRIICTHYLFRRFLAHEFEAYPERRSVTVKLLRSRVKGKGKVLGIILGLSFLKEHEVFNVEQILGGIHALLPHVNYVSGSFLCHCGRSDQICTLYLEVEYSGVTLEDESLLKEELPFELKERIEKRLNPLFMPQNEEEILHNIVTLSRQLKYVKDLPQVTLNFNKQTEDMLEFYVVCVRIARPGCPSICEKIDAKPTFLEYFPDRTKSVGMLKRRYPKEASVFRVRLNKDPFLRRDHSIDLNRARGIVAQELARLLGEFRDYNGGTLSKEREVFEKLREGLDEDKLFLLENLFYSLEPAMLRSTLPAEPIQKLFEMISKRPELVDSEYDISIQEDIQYFYCLVTATHPSFLEVLNPALAALKIPSFQLARTFLHDQEIPTFGLIFRGGEERKELEYTLEKAMTEWSEQTFIKN